jgi:prophage DNA circulation protein
MLEHISDDELIRKLTPEPREMKMKTLAEKIGTIPANSPSGVVRHVTLYRIEVLEAIEQWEREQPAQRHISDCHERINALQAELTQTRHDLEVMNCFAANETDAKLALQAELAEARRERDTQHEKGRERWM